MVVPFAAGGLVDVLGRILAQYLTEVIGKQVIVDNVPGGGGMSARCACRRRHRTATCSCWARSAPTRVNQTLSKKPLYNAATDFAPMALIADVGLVLIARKDLPAGDLAQFIAYAKANQGKMQYGSGGAGTSSHIGCVLVNQTIGIDSQHIPYRGGGPAMADLVAGRVDYVCNIASTVGQAIEGNRSRRSPRSRASARQSCRVSQPRTSRASPDLDAYTWNAVFLPKGTPPALVQRLNGALVAVMNNPAFRERASRARPDRRRAGAAHARLSAGLRRQRDREMGGPDQGERVRED